MKWKGNCCGNEMTKEDFENWAEHKENLDSSKFEDMDEEEVSAVILVDCPKCPEELAEYENNTTESQDSANTTTRSKMLQAARKRA